ncbi:hypothetical protein ACSLO9_34745, partial [Escherichia coli]
AVIESRIRKSTRRLEVNITFIISPGYFPYLTVLPLLLCCFIFPASGKDAGWQWYNEKINPKEKENK